MAWNKEKIKSKRNVFAYTVGILFAGMYVLAKKKKGDSNFEKEPEQQNPLEGKKVVFVREETDKVNADGVQGHLREVGDSNCQPNFYERYVKRGLDLVLSFGGLILLSPVFAAIALAIFLEDPGPVLFTQKRVGKNKRYFLLHKFRSMKRCTPHDVPTHMLENPEQYITKVGKFIRAHSLDELPQIWDIFIGNMSVIGPRPALWNQDLLVAEREKYGANEVKPGLTGWAQINGRDELEIAEKARLDGEYVKRESLWFDITCFLGTIKKIGHDSSIVEGGTGKKTRRKFLILTNHSYMLWQFRRELISELLKQGDVVIGTPFVGHEEDFAAMGCRMIDTPLERRGMNPITDGKLYCTYRKLLQRERPDKVITYSIKPNIYAGFLCRCLQIPYYANVQGLGSAFQTKFLSCLVTPMYQAALKNAQKVFFENSSDAREFVQRRITPQKKQVLLKGAGVNLNVFEEQPYPSETKGIHFLYLGRIMQEKGMEELFAAARTLKKQYGDRVWFDFVGFFEEEYKQTVEQLAQEGVIVFHGFQSNPKPYYARSHCVVLPSYHEGMSNVLLEAAATGRALITTRIPGCQEAVKENVTGYLCEKGDANGLAVCMERFLLLDEKARRKMGHLGRKKMEREFDRDRVVQTILPILIG